MLTTTNPSEPVSEMLGPAVDHSPFGFLVFDPDGRLLAANRRARERLGFKPEQLSGLTIGELDAGHSPETLEALWQRLLSDVGGRPEVLLTHHRDADGKTFPVETRMAAVDLDGTTRIVMLATAVTSDLVARQRLAEQERLFQQVFHASEDAILLLDGTEFIDCNEAAVRMLRCRSKDELLPVPPWGLSPEHQPDGRLSTEKARAMIEIAHRTHFHRFEWLHRRADGDDFPVEVTLTLLEWQGRQILHVVWNDITERKRNEHRIEKLARYDLLTGLPNRRLLQENADRLLGGDGGHRRPVGVMYMDLDRFKDINDTQGHETGDRVLAEVARRLRACLRENDTVARLGGDEFAFLLPDTEIAAMCRVADRVVEALEAPFQINGLSTRIGASIGLVCHPQHGTSLAELLKHADIAMYRAKERQSGWCLFEPKQASRVLERVNLERELREAISAGELTLHFQPIVAADTGRIECLEALARWPRADGKSIGADVFIPTAEATGLIHELGDALLELACRQAVDWRNRGLAPRIALNLSALELQASGLADRLLGAFDRHGLDGNAFEIEITESAAMSSANEHLAALGELKRRGVRISIDDFGTGYSSLSQLKQLPVDTLKVDQSFVRDMVNDPADANIVETIVLLAGAMGLETVAEGIETVEQFHAARQLGCDRMQGYLFARPADAQDVTELIEHGFVELPAVSDTRRPGLNHHD